MLALAPATRAKLDELSRDIAVLRDKGERVSIGHKLNELVIALEADLAKLKHDSAG